MRRIINLPMLSLFSGMVLLCSAMSIQAQNRDKFVISAKAGGINAVTGQAAMHTKGETDWQQLTVTDDLETGDRVRTATDGRVEILLNPGSYLRLGGDSEVELANNSLANLELRLIRGTAIVEAAGVEETQMLINISTPHARLAIDRQGLYRLNVVPDDATELIVRKGRVILGDSHTKIKGGNKVVFSATTVSVAKLTSEEKKLEKDVAIERWSKARAETLAKANSRLNPRSLNSAFSSVDSDFFLSGFGRSGYWLYNSRAGCYTFLPFSYGASSPYGQSYPTTVYGGYAGGGGYYPGYRPTSGYSGGNGNGGYQGGSSGSSSSGSSSAPTRTMPASSAPSMPSASPSTNAAPRDVDSGQRLPARPPQR
ncbi:MAG TPA: FecR family protein [Pyrinomonadaceae bacterium]